jgi:hypothetical protein
MSEVCRHVNAAHLQRSGFGANRCQRYRLYHMRSKERLV